MYADIQEQKVISASCIYNARRDRKRRQVMYKFRCGSTQWRTPRRIIKQFITRAARRHQRRRCDSRGRAVRVTFAINRPYTMTQPE